MSDLSLGGFICTMGSMICTASFGCMDGFFLYFFLLVLASDGLMLAALYHPALWSSLACHWVVSDSA